MAVPASRKAALGVLLHWCARQAGWLASPLPQAARMFGSVQDGLVWSTTQSAAHCRCADTEMRARLRDASPQHSLTPPDLRPHVRGHLQAHRVLLPASAQWQRSVTSSTSEHDLEGDIPAEFALQGDSKPQGEPAILKPASMREMAVVKDPTPTSLDDVVRRHRNQTQARGFQVR